MISSSDKERIKEIETRLKEIELTKNSLSVELNNLRGQCDHPNLSHRTLGESYRDVCPDCGFVSYCYTL